MIWYHHDGSAIFTDNEVEIYGMFLDGYKEFHDSYHFVEVGNFSYIEFNNHPEFRSLILRSEFYGQLIDQDNNSWVGGINITNRTSDIPPSAMFEALYIATPNKLSASSSLAERRNEYRVENLVFQDGRKSWVEGVYGQGIGKKIRFSVKKRNSLMHTIIISTGFVDYHNPNLFYENSRPRLIKIRDVDGLFEEIYALEDSPNPQTLHLPKPFEDVEIEIVDV